MLVRGRSLPGALGSLAVSARPCTTTSGLGLRFQHIREHGRHGPRAAKSPGRDVLSGTVPFAFLRDTASSQQQYGSALHLTRWNGFPDQGHAPQVNGEVMQAERGAALSSLQVFHDAVDHGQGRRQRASSARSLQACL